MAPPPACVSVHFTAYVIYLTSMVRAQGYCSPKGQRSRQQGSKSYGAVTHRLAVQDYQDMIDVCT